MKKIFTGDATDGAFVLAVSGDEELLQYLERLFEGSSWRFQAVATASEAEEWIRRNPTPVVLCGDCLRGSLLQFVAGRESPPGVIVLSRHADDRLLAEVLNLGGFDVVSFPFDRNIFQVVSAAWRYWKNRPRLKSDVKACA